MENGKLIAALQQIRTLADEALGKAGTRFRQTNRRRGGLIPKEAPAKTLPNHILRLRNDGLFKHAQTAKEVQAKLLSAYPCDLNRVAVALLRLQKRKLLRRTSKLVGKEKQVAYAW